MLDWRAPVMGTSQETKEFIAPQACRQQSHSRVAVCILLALGELTLVAGD